MVMKKVFFSIGNIDYIYGEGVVIVPADGFKDIGFIFSRDCVVDNCYPIYVPGEEFYYYIIPALTPNWSLVLREVNSPVYFYDIGNGRKIAVSSKPFKTKLVLNGNDDDPLGDITSGYCEHIKLSF